MARPTKFTPERRAAIIESISNRIPYELAAKANGIHEDTLYEWLNRGYKDIAAGVESEHARFSESLKKVEESCITSHLEYIQAGRKSWQAHAWILERRWSRFFSSNTEVKALAKEVDTIKALLNARDKNEKNDSKIKMNTNGIAYLANKEVA